MKRFPHTVLSLAAAAVAGASGVEAKDGPASPASRPKGTAVDAVVQKRLRGLDLEPAGNCPDAVFVRRVYLDLTGTLPAAAETREFLADRHPAKRERLVEELFERPEFADYWAMKWCDLLRVKSEFPINLWPNAVQAYHRWVRTGVAENKRYDGFVRELLTSSGSNFRVAPVNFYRAVQEREPEAIARVVALTFMGAQAGKWPEEQLEGMAGFFAGIKFKKTNEWKEEIVHVDLFDTGTGRAPGAHATLPDGTKVELVPGEDPRIAFAEWLIQPDNPWFTTCIANRMWAWFFGRGIIHEPDDIRSGNPPSNPELLALLRRELVRSGYDLRHLMRLVVNSATYQQSNLPSSDRPGAAAHFGCYPIRRLDAEVLIDAICKVTGTTEDYWSVIPEPYTFIPRDRRTIALADGSITSPFLELFGRPPRDTGKAAERDNQPTAAQSLHLLNSSHIRGKIERVRWRRLAGNRRDPDEAVRELYLTIVSRYPTEDELDTVRRYARTSEAGRRHALTDTAWALLNSPEFLFRH